MTNLTFVANSYSTPNEYVDRLMHLLTSDEWKVFSHTVRRSFERTTLVIPFTLGLRF